MFYEPTEHSVGIRQIAAGWLICGILLAGISALAGSHGGNGAAAPLQAAAMPHGGVAEAPAMPC